MANNINTAVSQCHSELCMAVERHTQLRTMLQVFARDTFVRTNR